MSEWRECRLEDLAASDDHALATGPFGSAISSRHFVDSGVPVIRGSNLSLDVGHRLIEDDFVFLRDQKAASFRRSVARRGDLVFTCWGTVGQVGFISSRSRYPAYVVSNKQMKMTPDPKTVDALFLYYLLSSPGVVGNVQGQAIGTSVPGFNLGQLRELRVRLPQLSAQRQIAEILGTIDDLIENNRRRIALLERMAQAIYREWFVHFRYPGHEDDEPVDSPLGLLPSSWSVVEMKDVCQVVDCLHSKKPSKDASGQGVLLQLFNIAPGGRLDLSELFLISDDDYRLWTSRIEVREGDCVVTNVGRVGAVAQIPAGVRAAIGRNMTAVRPREGLITPTYLLEYFLSAHMQAELGRKTDIGTIMDALNVKGIVRLAVPMPTWTLQQAFEDVGRPIRRLVEVLALQAQALRQTRDRLLPKLVTGAIDVSSVGLDALLEEPAA